MEQKWVSVGNRNELRDSNGRVLASEIVRDGRCIVFDLSGREAHPFKNLLRKTIGLNPVHSPKVIETIYRTSEMGRARENVEKQLREIDKQNIDASSKQAIKRDVVKVFREKYQQSLTRD